MLVKEHAIAQKIAPFYLVVLAKLQELSAPIVVDGRIHY
jgi:hypothetical protein